MKTSNKIVIAVGVAMLALMSHAQNSLWTGLIDNDFNNTNNWNAGLSGSVGIVLSGANVTMSAASPTLYSLHVGGTGTAPILNISQNVNIGTASPRRFYVGHASNDTDGVVNHTAGTLTASGLQVGAVGVSGTGTSNRKGTYNFSGGAINVTADIFYIGQYAADTAVMNLSGSGTVTSAAIVKMNRFGGSSTLSVTGGDLALNFNAGLTINENGSTGSSIINATIDSTGFSTINVLGDVQFNKAEAVNRTEFNLALGSGYVHTPNTTYTIINATGDFTGLGVFGNISDGQELTVDGNLFKANYVTGEGNDTFTITAIPEPATVGLFVISAAGLMIVRRCRI